jgi:hypothetical protein
MTCSPYSFVRIYLFTQKQFERLSNMPALEVLHFQVEYATQPVVAEQIALMVPGLTVVGLGDKAWDVIQVEGLIRLRAWSYKDLALRTSETIGSAGEWYAI